MVLSASDGTRSSQKAMPEADLFVIANWLLAARPEQHPAKPASVVSHVAPIPQLLTRSLTIPTPQGDSTVLARLVQF